MVNLIVATDIKRGIGKSGTIPWNVPEDLKFFKETTQYSCVIMGRKTWDSLPVKPLKTRINIVISSTLKVSHPEVIVVKSPQEALNATTTFLRDVYIIGGAEIYKWYLENTKMDRLYVTQIPKDYSCDTFLPEITENYKIFNSLDFATHKIITYAHI